MEDFIKQKISEGASKIVENAVDNLARRLPDDAAKKDFLARMKNLAAEGVDAIINGQDYQKHLGIFGESLRGRRTEKSLQRIAAR